MTTACKLSPQKILNVSVHNTDMNNFQMQFQLKHQFSINLQIYCPNLSFKALNPSIIPSTANIKYNNADFK